MGKIIEGYWDCPQCGSKKIRGRYRYCNSCGRPRGKGIKFYMLETDEYVEDDSKISREPDWYCSFCQSLNPAIKTVCESCGSSQEESDKNYFHLLEEEEQRKEEEKKIETQFQQERTNRHQERANRVIAREEESRNRFQSKLATSFLAKVALLLPFLLLIGFLIHLAIPKESTLYVNGKSWERSVEVQEYKTVQENDWYVPDGGRVTHTRDEIHHYDKVLDHYETITEQKSERYVSGYETVVTGHRDLGNGYFEEITSQQPVYDTRYWTETKQEPVYRKEPVYQTKYYYDIERWVHKSWETTSGESDAPYWATLNLKPDIEKEGRRTEKYIISTENKKQKEKSYEISLNDWERINKGDVLTLKISLGNITEILKIEEGK